MKTNQKPFAAISIGIGSGLIIGILFLLLYPWAYFEIADILSWRLNFPSVAQVQFEQTLTKIQLRGDTLVNESDTLLFGDSHLHAIPSTSVANSVNFAIGGETTSRLAKRIGRYPSLTRARVVVLMTGRNDLMTNASLETIERSMSEVLSVIPATTKVILISILPGMDNVPTIKKRLQANIKFSSLCENHHHCEFISLETFSDTEGRLSEKYDSGDGIHLNSIGYKLLTKMINSNITTPMR